LWVVLLQAQSDDDDVGPDDVAVPVESRGGDGFMDEFFAEVSRPPWKSTLFKQIDPKYSNFER